ncbi:MAG: SCP2 sterol-binding domain-containing protein [Betaproteobacteria bacterium]|nr:SCP2 sterol-binding domain-containing protein [Betaproteobacteria bacterium]MDE2623076.1 SCP2 sterol-binding domain-containing protein [Betaproteobacteria bacterium]
MRTFSWLTPERMPRPMLRLLPPPRKLSYGLALLPASWPGRAFSRLLDRYFLQALPAGSLDFLEKRRLSVRVDDLGFSWAITAEGGKLRTLPPDVEAEATIRGKMLDLLLLASHLEDADTLFFQRRLTMTGDTALGLQVRNLLDQWPMERLSPALQILLNRLTRLALAAKAARP